MIEINLLNLSKDERGTHEGYVTVHRQGKVFQRKQRLGQKKVESNKDKYINSLKDVELWINNNPNRKEDINNVINYCKSGYEHINKTMRRIPDNIFNSYLPPEDIQSISNFLHDAPKFNGIVYRGVSINNKIEFDKFMQEIKKGIIQIKPFTSTTINQKLSKAFAYLYPRNTPPIYMEIKSKNGVVVSGLSHFSSEDEVLFDYGTKFKVIDYNINQNEINIKLEEI